VKSSVFWQDNSLNHADWNVEEYWVGWFGNIFVMAEILYLCLKRREIFFSVRIAFSSQQVDWNSDWLSEW